MHFPFQNELDDAFRNGRSVGVKIGGAVVVTVAVVAYSLTQFGGNDERTKLSGAGIALTLGIAAVAGAVLGVALVLKDSVEARLAAGQRVHPLLKLLFGMRILSLLIWFPLTLFGFVVASLLWFGLSKLMGPG